MKLSYTAFREAQRLAGQATLLSSWTLAQYRFVPVTWDGDAEGRTWAIVDDKEIIDRLKRRIGPLAQFNVNGKPVPIHFDEKERPLLVVHTVS
jgi:hypothetical protein